MSRQPLTPAEIELQIREWFERHRDDYCHHDLAAPPKVWSEYFQWLLDRLDVLAEVGDSQRSRRQEEGQ